MIQGTGAKELFLYRRPLTHNAGSTVVFEQDVGGRLYVR
jgi:hypothetical protein